MRGNSSERQKNVQNSHKAIMRGSGMMRGNSSLTTFFLEGDILGFYRRVTKCMCDPDRVILMRWPGFAVLGSHRVPGLQVGRPEYRRAQVGPSRFGWSPVATRNRILDLLRVRLWPVLWPVLSVCHAFAVCHKMWPYRAVPSRFRRRESVEKIQI